MKIGLSLWTSFETYLLVDRKMSNHKSSVYALRSRFKKLVYWFEGKDFTRENVTLFIGEMQKQNAAKSYMNKMIALCKHLDKFLRLNQFQDYTYFKESYQTKQTLTPQEIEALASITLPYRKHAECINLRQNALIMLLGTTGSRIGEALNLKWHDVYDGLTTHVLYRETKNGEERAVPIGKTVLKLIQALPQKGENVFASYRGGRVELQEVNLDLKRRAKAIGLTKPITNHIFRHSYITTMLELGTDVSDVARIVGHKNLNSTMRYKNSLLGYYSQVAQLHPLLKQSLTLNQMASQIKTHLDKLVDSAHFSIEIAESSTSFRVRVSRLPDRL